MVLDRSALVGVVRQETLTEPEFATLQQTLPVAAAPANLAGDGQ